MPGGSPGKSLRWTSRTPLIRYKSFSYQADSWTTARRVVAKVEHHAGELFPRVGFIVTNHLTRRLFGAMLQRIWALPVPTG